MAQNTHSDSSEQNPLDVSHLATDIETVIALWTLLERIQQIKDNDKRDSAEATWFELARTFITWID